MKAALMARFARFVAKRLHHLSSDHCKLLMEAVHKKGYGHVPYTLQNAIRSWARISDNWVDKYVIAVALEKHEIEFQKAHSVFFIAVDWDEEAIKREEKIRYEKMHANEIRGYGAESVVRAQGFDAVEQAMRLSKGNAI